MASNPNVNQVIYEGRVILDLTNDTVEPEYLLTGYTAHAKNGATIVGTYSGGGTNTADANITASDVRSGMIAYGNSGKVTGAMQSMVFNPVGPSVVNESGLMQVSIGTTNGYWGGEGWYTYDNQLNVKSAQTYTPSESTQTISKYAWLTGDQTIAAIPSQYKNTTDANVTANDIVSGKVGYGNSGRLVGTYVPSGTPSSYVEYSNYVNGYPEDVYIHNAIIYTRDATDAYNSQYCYAKNITIDNCTLSSNGACFINCKSLTNVNFVNQSSLSNIYRMFYNCSSLESISMIPSITGSYYGAFAYCNSLKYVGDIYGDLSSSGSASVVYPFEYTSGANFTVGNIYGSNYAYCFYDSGIYSVGNIDSIENGSYMFRDSTKLVSFGGTLRSLTNGSRMFFNCRSLKSTGDLNCVNIISSYQMFWNCISLATIGNVYANMCASSVSDSPFNGCSNLTKVGDVYGYNASYMFPFCGTVSGFSVGNIHSSYCQRTFYNSGVTSTGNISNVIVGDYMFYNAKKITSVYINSPYLNNAYYMFCYATSLTSVYINSLVVSNCSYCFRNTSTAKSVYLHRYYANGVQSLTWNTFNAAYGSGANGVTLIEY